MSRALALCRDRAAVVITVSGVRVRSKIVPAVTEVRWPQAAHMMPPSPQRPAPTQIALLAHDPLRPSHLLQVVQTVSICANHAAKHHATGLDPGGSQLKRDAPRLITKREVICSSSDAEQTSPGIPLVSVGSAPHGTSVSAARPAP